MLFAKPKAPYRLSLVVIAVTFSLLAACENTGQQTATTEPRIRAAIEASSANTIKATVFVEGPDGNAVSGAVVILKDDYNTVTHLAYNSTTCSYNAVLEESATTQYTVEAVTILSDTTLSLTVPYSKLDAVPQITVFQDSEGNSVLKNNPLSSGLPIQIGWKDCGEGIVYKVEIGTNLSTVYSVSTKACTVTIDASVIKAGAYLIEITAQKINGDILYRTAPYYSASFTSAPLQNFNVN